MVLGHHGGDGVNSSNIARQMAEQNSIELVGGHNHSNFFSESKHTVGGDVTHFANADSIVEADLTNDDGHIEREELIRKINMAREQISMLQERGATVSTHGS